MVDRLDRYGELSRFLRLRRERMTPKQAGLPESGRRRTPGLRRSEVAQLADVGLDWTGTPIWNKGVLLTYPLRYLIEYRKYSG